MSEPTAPPPEPWLRMTITPEPTGDEGEAIVAAIATYLTVQQRAQPSAPVREPSSRWLIAGRREAVRGRAGSPRSGWGRERAGWP